VDAEAAARAVLCGEASGIPKSAEGAAEALRALRVARRSALKARTQAGNQVRDLIISAPGHLRAEIGQLSLAQQVTRCARWRTGPVSADAAEATRRSLRILSRRHQALTAEIDELDQAIAEVCAAASPALLAAAGVGPDVASALLVAAGDNPDRMRSEASFAALCGGSPVEASSGKITRHRLNRAGNRDANNALWRIAMVRRAHHHPPTEAYFDRRRKEGKNDREILRCLKRYIAREVFRLLTSPGAIPSGAALREHRVTTGLSLAAAAAQLGTSQARLSRLERGTLHNADLAASYQELLTSIISPAA
jgi:transposase